MERKVEQPRYTRRNPWSPGKTTIVLLGVALVGSAATLLFDSLAPSNVTWSDEAFLPPTSVQTAIGNVAASTSAAKAEPLDFDYIPDPDATIAVARATHPNGGKQTALKLASAGKASVRPSKVAKPEIQQVNPENQTVGCAGGENAVNDCL
jgi:hypothetical protein